MESKGVYLNEIPLAREITLLAAIVDKEIRPKRNGGSYLALRLADRSAELDAKVWDNPGAVAQLFSTSDVVKVRGTVEHYNDKPQLIISRLRRCEPQEYDAADFYPASRRDPAEMFGELHAFVAMIRDDSLRQLIDSIVNHGGISDRLRTAPAALKIHHAFRSGLLEHIVSLCSLSVALTAHYERLNLDWLIAGAILHDLGKIDTLTSNGVRFDYTTRGQLIEHVTLGLEILERHASRLPDFPLELKTVLQHLIVSHHGDLEKRSAPATNAAGGVRAVHSRSAGCPDGTDLPDHRLGARGRRVHTIRAVAGTAVVPWIYHGGRRPIRKRR
jgi:3'-5' exoribonuclease